MSNLAILGGPPAVVSPIPINRNRFSFEDKNAIRDYLDNENILSFYGDEGLQKEYELSLKRYFDAEYCVLVNSGTDSLYAAYFALGLMPDDEIIVPAFSFFAIASPLLLFPVKIIIADCDSYTGLIDPKDVLSKITERTKAVVINHVCGDSIDIDIFIKDLKARNVCLIEDLSLAFGGTHNGRKLGTYGDITCCSLGSTKMLSGGQGGFIITNKREYFERIILLGCFGQRAKQNVYNPFYRQFSNVSYGLNLRMQSLAIAVSYSRFRRIDELIQMRHERYNLLTSCISQYERFLRPPRTLDNKFRGSWHGYYATFSDELNIETIEKVIVALQAEGLCVRRQAHYPLLNREKVFWCEDDGILGINKNPIKKGCKPFSCPNAEKYNNRILSFPLFLDEPIEYLMQYCSGLNKVLSNVDKL